MIDYQKKKTPCQFLVSYKYIEPYVKNKKTLDLGCATGEYLETFSSNSEGTDFSDINISICHSKGLKVTKSDFNTILPFRDESFEVVFCSHVLEHVDCPLNVLREINRILKKGGLLILGLPIEASLVRFFKDRYFEDHSGHIYSFSIENIKRLLNFSEFKCYKIIWDIVWGRKFFLRWLLGLVQKLPLNLVKWWANGYWVIAVKNNNDC